MEKYKTHFKNREFVGSAIFSIVLLIISLIVNFYAGLYATASASNAVTDLILSNIRVYDVDSIFVYGPLFLWIFVALLIIKEPNKIPFTLKSIAVFTLVRSLFITLTHIGEFPTSLVVNSTLMSKFTSGGDLFFSGHTGLPFLMALVFWQQKSLRYIFIVASIVFGATVLMAHVHYSIDVLSAFFITYTIFHISEFLFRKDRKLFYFSLGK